jgi:protein-L-isoaspartate(D-aspartate) O-methyltransferase
MQSALDRAKQTMLSQHLRQRGIRAPRVLEAMAVVPREAFVPLELRDAAYDDRALTIDCGQTISQPYIVAAMSEALQLAGGEHVLEIGAGSGYQTAVLAHLAASVVSIERHAALAQLAQARLKLLAITQVRFVIGDGTLGWPAAAPYDAILAAAATARVPPAWLEQLREGGRIVVPLGTAERQTLTLIRKHQGAAQTIPMFACRFVPLVEGPAEAPGEADTP